MIDEGIIEEVRNGDRQPGTTIAARLTKTGAAATHPP
jgi:hypothetical protein